MRSETAVGGLAVCAEDTVHQALPVTPEGEELRIRVQSAGEVEHAHYSAKCIVQNLRLLRKYDASFPLCPPSVAQATLQAPRSMIGVSLPVLWLLQIAVTATEASTTLRADGTFKIVQIADLHYDGDPTSDAASDRVNPMFDRCHAWPFCCEARHRTGVELIQ